MESSSKESLKNRAAGQSLGGNERCVTADVDGQFLMLPQMLRPSASSSSSPASRSSGRPPEKLPGVSRTGYQPSMFDKKQETTPAKKDSEKSGLSSSFMYVL